MKTNKLIGLSLALPFAAGLALAQSTQTQLPTVEVVTDAEESMTFDCRDPVQPELKEVSRILNNSDAGRAPDLRKKLMAAAAEACSQGQPRILVERTVSGVTWRPLDSPAAGSTEQR